MKNPTAVRERYLVRWSSIWPDPVQRAAIADQTQGWSDRVLALSGLLSEDTHDQ